MKQLLLVILLLLSPCSIWAGTGQIQAIMGMWSEASTGGGGGITDDFSGTEAKWSDYHSAFTIGSGVYTGSGWFVTDYTNESTGSVNQWVKVKASTVASSMGVVLRSPGVTSGNRYVLHYTGGNWGVMLYSSSSDWVSDSSSDLSAPDIVSGDVVGITIAGTGAARKISIWLNPTAATPYNADNWDSSSDPADDTTVTLDWPAGTEPTGQYVGLHCGTSACSFDDFSAGALP